ncbi:MAG: helix-turn-helix transcriptional regulator [Bacillota bacterium]|nr:helix-turn-helix transcriptional regulator [Bacillota bacterium]
MISSDVIRGYNDTIILSLLLEKDSYGYEISRKVREISEERYIMKETTLYSAFNRLEKNGYIESFYGSETFGKRRTYYRITEEGRRYYKEKCEEWRLTQEVISRFIEKTNEE